MKNTAVGCRILCILLIMLLMSVPVSAVSTAEDMSVTQGCHSIDAQVPMLEKPEDLTNLYSAVVYDYTNDTLICAVNPDEKFDPASLVKIMTGLIIAEKGNMDDRITVDSAILDVLPPNSLGVDLRPGESISMRDLLYCVLVESANDASVVAAYHICGSLDAFVAEMNRYAKELGCENTVFTNVHGIHDEFQVSTARDIARILTHAVNNEVFMEAFSTVNYTVSPTNMSDARELSSGNYLMNDDMMTIYLDSRVTGGRAGVMDTGERNLAVTAERNGVKLISVLFGSQSVFAENGYSVITFGSFYETSQLLDLGFKGHQSVQLFYENQAVKQFEVKNGDSYVSTGVTRDVMALLPHGVAEEDVIFRYSTDLATLQAPVKTGDLVTSVQVWHNDICLAQADLFALHDVKFKEIVETEAIAEERTTSGITILIIVAIIIGLFVVLLFGRRVIFRMIRKHQIRRHRKNRRRSR